VASLADRRTAALTALALRTPPAQQRYPGETQPSGDMPDDPWQAEAYLAATRWLDADKQTTAAQQQPKEG
jgi:hypothetical protein